MDRRTFLRAAGLMGLLPATSAWAFGRTNQLTFALLDTADERSRRVAWKRLGLEVEARTSITVVPQPLLVDGGSDAIFNYPLLICSGSGDLPAWSAQRWARLAHYLRSGGMIIFDQAQEDDGFSKACLQRLARQLPKGAQQQLTKDHVLYRSFYLLETPVGRHLSAQQPQAALVDGRMVALALEVDLAGSLLRDEFGAWAYPCNPGGEAQREQAIRFGVNLLMYALCTDYKADQVHIPFLLKRRR